MMASSSSQTRSRTVIRCSITRIHGLESFPRSGTGGMDRALVKRGSWLAVSMVGYFLLFLPEGFDHLEHVAAEVVLPHLAVSRQAGL
jgi:hypothetical protein